MTRAAELRDILRCGEGFERAHSYSVFQLDSLQVISGQRLIVTAHHYWQKGNLDLDKSGLLGSWRMISWTRKSVETGEVTDALGPEPIGYIAYHADGRMMATVFRRDRLSASVSGWSEEEKSQLFDDMLAYVASYSLEGDRVVHHVDGSWNPNWHGDLSRPFVLEGDRLVISGAPGVDPRTGDEVVYRMEFTKVLAD